MLIDKPVNPLKSANSKFKKFVILGGAIGAGFAGVGLYQVLSSQVLQGRSAAQEQSINLPEIKTVTALGRIEPKGKVIKLSAPASTQGSRVEKLLVAEGETVQTGQAIAVLDNSEKLKAAQVKAQEAVRLSQANLAQVQAGAKTGEINAQKSELARIQAQSLGEERTQRESLARLEAEWSGNKAVQQASVSRLEAQLEGDKNVQAAAIKKIAAELSNARSELSRYEQLYKAGAIAQSQYDTKRLTVDTLAQQLNEAKAILSRSQSTGNKQISEGKANLQRIIATGSKQVSEAQAVLARIQSTSGKQASSAKGTLSKIQEVRPVDIAAAQAELRQSIAAAQEAKVNFEQSFVKAPANGVVFKINTRPGETVGNNGILELGEVKEMTVVAEVYQTSISKIKAGQTVKITSSSLPSDLSGKVETIGWQIQRQNVINADPTENIDSRVVEVRIILDPESSQKAAKFTNLQVKTIFKL
jgi:HlyD family secretion protein